MFGKPRRDTMRNRARCRVCGRGTCECTYEARKDRARVKHTDEPRPCGEHIGRTGATCYKTVSPRHPCPRGH